MSAPRSVFGLHTVRLAAVPAAVFIAACLDRGYQTDYWQHLARGRLVAREGAVVSVDRFTFTVPGEPFVDNNWLSQLLYHALHSAGGLELVQVVNAAVLAVTLGLVVRLCRGASGSTGWAAVVGAVAFLGLWQTFLIRPQSFSMLLFAVLYGLLLCSRRRPGLLVVVPFMMALWANAHGGFAVGLALIGTFAIGEWLSSLSPVPGGEGRGEGPPSGRPEETHRGLTLSPEYRGEGTHGTHPFRLLACLGFGTAATLANPYGWDVYRYAGRLSAVGVGRGIEEWLPPALGSLNGSVWAASLGVTAVLVGVAWRRVTWTELCIVCCFAAASFVSTRMTVWWFLAAAPVAARLLGVTRAGPAGAPVEPPGVVQSQNLLHAGPSIAAGAALALLISACALSLPWLEGTNPLMGSVRPARRVEADLEAVANRLGEAPPDAAAAGGRPAGVTPLTRRLFTRMEWANYFAWASDGRLPVFAEGRVELYPDAVWDEYLAVSAVRACWETVLERRGVDLLVLDRIYHGRLIDAVEKSDRWQRRGGEGPAVLYTRRRGGAAPSGPAIAAGGDGAGAEH